MADYERGGLSKKANLAINHLGLAIALFDAATPNEGDFIAKVTAHDFDERFKGGQTIADLLKKANIAPNKAAEICESYVTEYEGDLPEGHVPLPDL